MQLTKKLPTEPGYYWWTDFGEHTPTILRVTKEGGKLYASNEEYSFKVEAGDEELWCRIPNPIIDGEVVEPDSY